MLPEILALARSWPSVAHPLATAAAVGARLGGAEHVAIVNDALGELEVMPRRALTEIFGGVAPQIPLECAGRAATLARTFLAREEFSGGRGLNPPVADLDPAWALAANFDFAIAATALAPRLAELGLPDDALPLARAVRDPARKAGVLIRMLPHLPANAKAEALGEALEHLLAAERDQAAAPAANPSWGGAPKASWLRAWIAPHLPETEGIEAVRAAFDRPTLDIVGFEAPWTLSRLVDLLSTRQLEAALDQLRRRWQGDPFRVFSTLLSALAQRGKVDEALERGDGRVLSRRARARRTRTPRRASCGAAPVAVASRSAGRSRIDRR